MHESRQDLLYRKLNRLTAALVVCVAVLSLGFTIVIILFMGNLSQTRYRVEQLARQMDEMRSTPPVPRTASKPSEASPRPARDAAGELMQIAASLRGRPAASIEPAELSRQFDRADTLAEAGSKYDGQAALILAEVAERTGRSEAALRWGRRALTRNEGLAGARLVVARVLHAAGKEQEALAELDRVIQRDSRSPHAHLLRAVILDRLDRPAESIRAYTTAQQFSETTVPATRALVRKLLDREEVDAAGLALNHPLVAGNSTSELLMLRGELAARQERYTDAVKLLTQAGASVGNDISARVWLGRSQLYTGQDEVARETFSAVAAKAPERPEGWYWQGILALRAKDSARAIPLLQKAIAADASFVPAFEHLGMALVNVQRLEEAVDVLSEAIKLDADSGQAHFALAVCHAKRARRNEALSSLKRAVDLDRKFVELAKESPIFATFEMDELAK